MKAQSSKGLFIYTAAYILQVQVYVSDLAIQSRLLLLGQISTKNILGSPGSFEVNFLEG